ncbi:MAG: NAD(P)-dependent oxidoreductase [Clostridium paraputrificum]|nr:NAD(P)-dependent oxidoreductase [Clostridium paraputrificum]MDY4721981.1 NAD(P)-dependent oxidoreductase [Clostridium paraputrificum]
MNNILVTGANGFIGKSFLNKLKGDKLFDDDNIILLSSNKIDGDICILHKNYNFKKEDFYENGIEHVDILVHIGAFIPKNFKEKDNIEKSISNINNTMYLLNNLPSIPKKIIFLSTIDIYGDTNEIIDENKIPQPDSQYGMSKLFCEKMLEVWCNERNVILQILRIGHIYGIGEEKYGKLIPSVMKNIISNERPVIYSDGNEKRSFLHVDDCCRLIIKSFDLNTSMGPINIVSNKARKIVEIVNDIIDISGKNIEPKILKNKVETKNLVFDNKKMESILGKEKILFYKGLKEEYEYFQERENKKLFLKKKI